MPDEQFEETILWRPIADAPNTLDVFLLKDAEGTVGQGHRIDFHGEHGKGWVFQVTYWRAEPTHFAEMPKGLPSAYPYTAGALAMKEAAAEKCEYIAADPYRENSAENCARYIRALPVPPRGSKI